MECIVHALRTHSLWETPVPDLSAISALIKGCWHQKTRTINLPERVETRKPQVKEKGFVLGVNKNNKPARISGNKENSGGRGGGCSWCQLDFTSVRDFAKYDHLCHYCYLPCHVCF